MTAWVVEPLVPHRDLDEVLRVEDASFINPWTREMFTWELTNSDVSHVFVVRRSRAGPLAGYCCVWLLFDELHINHVAVSPELRGQGAGTALMQHVLAEALRRGARRATLEVRRSNEAARRLYERLGFVEAGVRRGYYTQPVEDAIVSWCDLVPPTPADKAPDAMRRSDNPNRAA